MTPKYTPPEITGWMTAEELEWLFKTAQEMESIVEIGSWMGKSTHALLSGCKGAVYAVDHWKGSPNERDTTHSAVKTEDIHKTFMDNVGHFPNLRVLQMDSEKAALLFPPRSVDMVFIDGGHDYDSVRKDIEKWRPIYKKLFCGHDLGQDGVQKALTDSGLKWEQVKVGTLWKAE